MTLKLVNNADPGDSNHVGGNDWDQLATIVNNTFHPYSYIIYKSSTTYKAFNSITQNVDSTSTTDSSTPINYALAHLPSTGGKVFIKAGQYSCKTTIQADITASGKHYTEIEGEGHSTLLDFIPTGAVTDAILLKVRSPGLSNIRIRGNDDITNLVTAKATGSNPRHDFGYINHVTFDGANVPDTNEVPNEAPVSGQKGFYMDGAAADAATFFWKISNCDFRLLDIGMHLYNQFATSTHQVNNVFFNCNTGEKISGGQHNISNIWAQGESNVGQYAIHLTSEGTGNANLINISNVHAELVKSGTVAAVYIQGQLANIRLVNIFEAATGSHILDESSVRANFDLERSYFQFPSTTYKLFGWFTGHHPPNTGDGILNGRLADFGETIASLNAISGVFRSPTTNATINSTAGIIHTGSYIIRAANPEFRTRIFVPDTTSERIFIGLINVHAGASIVSTSDMLNTPRKGVGLWLDTGVSSNWKVMSNSGTGASTTADLSTPIAVSAADVHVIRIVTTDLSNTFSVYYDNIKTDITSDIPAAVDDLSPLISIENLAASARQILVYYGELTVER